MTPPEIFYLDEMELQMVSQSKTADERRKHRQKLICLPIRPLIDYFNPFRKLFRCGINIVLKIKPY